MSLSTNTTCAWGASVAALLGHKMPGHTVTEMYAAADPAHMQAAKAALDELLRAVCALSETTASTERASSELKSLENLERAKGFEPSTLTLAT